MQKELLQGMRSLQGEQCEDDRENLAGNDGRKIAGKSQIRYCETKKKAQCKTEEVLYGGFRRFSESVQNSGQCSAKAEEGTEQCALTNTASCQGTGKQKITDRISKEEENSEAV